MADRNDARRVLERMFGRQVIEQAGDSGLDEFADLLTRLQVMERTLRQFGQVADELDKAIGLAALFLPAAAREKLLAIQTTLRRAAELAGARRVDAHARPR